MEGALAYDSYMKTGRVATLLHDRFQQGLQEDFMNPDGSIVALRSAISRTPSIHMDEYLG